MCARAHSLALTVVSALFLSAYLLISLSHPKPPLALPVSLLSPSPAFVLYDAGTLVISIPAGFHED